MHLSTTLSMCRLCAGGEPQARLVDTHSVKGKQLRIEEMIKQYTPFSVLQETGLPCGVCNICVTKLQLWHAFVMHCKEAQDKLKKNLNKFNKIESVDGVKKLVTKSTSKSAESLSLLIGSSNQKKKSSNYCVARWCNKGNYRGVSLFRFPKERDRAMVWLTKSERLDLKGMASFRNHYLCASHFTSNMFTNKACNHLIRRAVPTIFPKPDYAHKMICKEAAVQVMPSHSMGVPLKTILPKVSGNLILCERKKEGTSRGSHYTKAETNSLACDLARPLNKSDVSVPNFLLQFILPKTNSCVGTPESISDATNSCDLSSIGSRSDDLLNSNILSSESESFARLNHSDNPIINSHHPTVCGADSHYNAQLNVTKEADLNQCIVVERASFCNDDVGEMLLRNNTSDPECDGDSPKTSNIPEVLQISNIGSDVVYSPCKLQAIPRLSKDVLDDFGPCAAQESKQESFTCEKSAIFGDSCGLPNTIERYSATAGTQDLLLTHLINKHEKPVSSFPEQNLSLGCDLSQADMQDGPLGVLPDSPHCVELNTSSSLFDIQTDDVRDSAVYMQHMENLDELMDLDNFFKHR